ncbi:LacI family DNA-binding transcriptional regulator [Rhodococcus koreensis]
MTIVDVARAAGVSKTTASDAVNGSPRVSSATSAQVRRVADELGYIANSAARSLRERAAGTIGLYAQWSARTASTAEWYMSVFRGVLEEANSASVDVVVLSPSRNPGSFRLPRCDGIIVIDPDEDDPTMARILNGHLPVVTGEHAVGGRSVLASASVNHAGAFSELMDHLADRGAHRVGFIYCPERTEWATSLKGAFDRWVTEHPGDHVAVPVPLIWTESELNAAISALLDTSERVDAIVCGPVGSATFVAARAAERGRRLGGDLLLAACTDAADLRSWVPAITAIDDSPRDFGAECFRLLHCYLKTGTADDVREPLPATLLLRASTGD